MLTLLAWPPKISSAITSALLLVTGASLLVANLLLVTSASLLVTRALLPVANSY